MTSWSKEFEVRWADLDPNFHLRHSVYYDFGAAMRVDMLSEFGITPAFMRQHQLGPIILREECVFLKEISSGDRVSVDVHLLKARRDYSRWTFVHHIFKNDTVISAKLTIDGAWLNTEIRKLTVPPIEVLETFKSIPTAEDFAWDEKTSKSQQ
ncbi:MAG: acyl-CoA thioesterase [Chitinophagaceae bacterium]